MGDGRPRPAALAVEASSRHNARMLALPGPRWANATILAVALSFLGACKKSGNLPGINGPTPEARAGLLSTVTVAPLDGIVAHVDALSRALQLPFAGKDLLTTLAAQNDLPPEALAQLDGRRPIALAFVAPPQKD